MRPEQAIERLTAAIAWRDNYNAIIALPQLAVAVDAYRAATPSAAAAKEGDDR